MVQAPDQTQPPLWPQDPQAVRDLIEAHLHEYPGAEFGPAHIVVSDLNLADHHIGYCTGIIDTILGNDMLTALAGLGNEGGLYERGHNRAELQATRDLLNTLSLTPLPIRMAAALGEPEPEERFPSTPADMPNPVTPVYDIVNMLGCLRHRAHRGVSGTYPGGLPALRWELEAHLEAYQEMGDRLEELYQLTYPPDDEE